MKNWKIFWLSLLCLFLWSGYCFADVINPGRPFSAFGTSSDDPPTTLQQVLNNITTGGPGIDAVNDQINNAIFTNDASGGSVATFIIEIAGFANQNTFGIYSSSDSSKTAQIFGGTAGSPGDQAFVSYNLDGTIEVNGTVVASGFSDSFGFYITTPQSNTFYSEDSLNSGNPQALIYQGDNQTELQIGNRRGGIFSDNEFIIAFEDIVFTSSDKDFQDLVVLVESIRPVPEPATLVISGIFLIGAGFFVRRKLHRKIS
jgi:hypothetical protein